MLKVIAFFPIIYVLFLPPSLSGKASLGYVTNATMNLGDDIQSIAVKRFFENDAVVLDKKFVSELKGDIKIKTVVSGLLSHDTKGHCDLSMIGGSTDLKINPFFISINIPSACLETVLSDENSDFLKAQYPVGARDLFTLNELRKRGIPSYFSGCLSLALENPYTERNDIIYLVDLDNQLVNYIKSKVKSPVVVLTHIKTILPYLNNRQRMQYAEYMLDLYRKAKCVVTTRLQAAMSCLAFETPVLMVSSEKKRSVIDARFTGLIDHVHNYSKEGLLLGEIYYDFDNPPKNPTTYLPIREMLIKIMTQWVHEE